MGIRAKVVFSFLSLLVAPFLIVLIALVILFSGAVPTPDINSLAALDQQIQQAQSITSERWFEMDDSSLMASRIKPLLEGHFQRLIVFDNNDLVRYDSAAPEWIGKPLSDNPEYSDLTSGLDAPVLRNGFQVGRLVLVPNLSFKRSLNILVYLPVFLIILFILTIIAMIIILSKILADGILKPLNQLGMAAERIAEGDLDFHITHLNDDEIGTLSKAFDRMRIKLKTSLEKQEQYETSRRRLIASISHDLRTPLTSIRGYVEGLQDGLVQDEETQTRYLRVIHEKTGRLNHLIDDLFIFSKMSLDEFQIERVAVPADQFLEEMLGMKEMEMKDHRLQLEVVRPFPNVSVQVDPDRIGQVLDNLVDNAVKYAQSYIRIRTHLENKRLHIYVQDDGPGIPPEDLPLIFDHFYKVDQVRNTKVKGTGLGLAICKQLIEAHDGSIHVKSREGKGTTFKIELPIWSG